MSPMSVCYTTMDVVACQEKPARPLIFLFRADRLCREAGPAAEHAGLRSGHCRRTLTV